MGVSEGNVWSELGNVQLINEMFNWNWETKVFEMDCTARKMGEEWSISLVKEGFPRKQVQKPQIWSQACWCGDGDRQEGNQKRLGNGGKWRTWLSQQRCLRARRRKAQSDPLSKQVPEINVSSRLVTANLRNTLELSQQRILPKNQIKK